MDNNEKKTIFSGIQPSGSLTIGNYLGAIKSWVELQDEYECYFCIVDQHAITVRQKPADLRKRTIEVLALYLACGIDPDKSTIFIQSHVSEHVQLQWILASLTYVGELNRMIQFKEKARKNPNNINAALYTYPVLMASDILLYNAHLVPVGDDQRQHIEITRDVAQRFNNVYSPTFNVPDIFTNEKVSRIMSLQNPLEKMSKSDEDENAYISLVEEDNVTANKIKKAVTDSEGIIKYRDEQPAIKNLINIYSAFSGKIVDEIVNEYENIGYSQFKKDLSEITIEYLRPIRTEYEKLLKDKGYLKEVYEKGRDKAKRKAWKTLSKVYRKIGFVKNEK